MFDDLMIFDDILCIIGRPRDFPMDTSAQKGWIGGFSL